jgi:diguanylate cyclase (GGDEF)-like protein/PAS domain S-box-containing protein
MLLGSQNVKRPGFACPVPLPYPGAKALLHKTDWRAPSIYLLEGMVVLRRAALILFVSLVAIAPGRAEERILSFISDIEVRATSDLRVTETIRIEAEGDQFRHGLRRDFPTIRTGRDGTRVKVSFTVEQVMREREFLQSIVDNLPHVLSVKRASDRKYVLINKAAERLFDIPLDQQIGRTAEDIFLGDAAEVIKQGDAEALAKRGEAIKAQFSLDGPDGTRLYQSLRLAFGSEGPQEHILVLLEDITDRIEAQARIAYLAHHDAMTELPNRHTFELYLGAAVDRARGTGEALAVVYIGLDHFKEINDLFGTSVGDAVLRTVAERLTDAAHDAFAARMGGDEFAIVCTGPQPAGAEQLIAKISDSLGEEVNIEGHAMRIVASMGVSIFPGDADTFADLIANADTAMERAKAEGRHTVRFFDRQTDRELREKRALHHDLRFAVERDELHLAYQPWSARIGP